MPASPFAQHLPVVARVAPVHAYGTRAAVGALVVPGRSEIVCREAVVSAQILRGARRAVLRGISGVCADDTTIRRELARGERRVAQLGDGYGDSEALVHHAH